MEESTLRASWSSMGNTPKTTEDIRNMMRENKHPVLKHIRKQLFIETFGFLVLLIVYYDIFDGDTKPVYANLLLAGALLLTILQNIIGYWLTKQPVKGDNLKGTLVNRIARWRLFAIISVSGRVAAVACLLLFFSTVITFTPAKTWMLAAAIVIFAIQLVFLSRLWIKRINQLRKTLIEF